ncbi:MAG: hypothetical protein FWF01_00880 [Alphaproteobacteria bacterium]|nr:hypothetical protein [Alphaproteobacteria bacterium]
MTYNRPETNEFNTYVFDLDGTLHGGGLHRAYLSMRDRNSPCLRELLILLNGRLILFTGSGRENAEESLRQLGVLDLFEKGDGQQNIFTNEESGLWGNHGIKSVPETYADLAKAAGFDPAKAVYFDDNEEYGKAAEKAGLAAVNARFRGLEERLQKFLLCRGLPSGAMAESCELTCMGKARKCNGRNS